MTVSAPKSNRRPGRPTSSVAGSIREDLLNAAIDLFSRRGFDGVSLRQIADAVGADIALTRYYFGSKEDTWKAAVDQLGVNFALELQKTANGTYSSKTEMMKAVIRWFVSVSARWPQLSKIIAFEGSDRGVRGEYIAARLVAPFYAFMDTLITDAKSEGTIVDVSPRTIFFMITHGGSFPMALPVLTNRFPGGDISEVENLNAHAEAIIKLIFKDSPPS
ncbi:TetR family transcriptional regulator [Yoonia maricola]|uniref:TetR family transcriptional regulator n=1 Tax=Yoonia maricola TaxID=420999 RepID=A0A2M8W6D2_9RHOB|nr:TetR/AcrR family transcriptional regulator [Yoonia maricola]PJI86473.1 TetR family transcriptional regulator [Yoonia maricola]